MLDPKRALLWLLVLVSAAGCVPTVAARGSVLLPAKVPVRSFPEIWVSGGELEDETYLQDRLATHLAGRGREVRRVELGDLEPARKNGHIPASTVVVLVDLETTQGEREEWANSPMQVCSVYGCFNQYEAYTVNVPEVRGKVLLTVHEGPSARVLQRLTLRRSVAGEDGHETANALMEELAKELERSVDILRMRERVELYRVKVPGVDEAIALIRAGKWVEGRALLERAKDQLGGQSKKVQARVWFNLGLARWFGAGPAGLTAGAHADARRAFEQAIELDDHPVHERALERLDKARESYAAIEAQRAATAANYALRTHAADAAPDAPAAMPSAAPAP